MDINTIRSTVMEMTGRYDKGTLVGGVWTDTGLDMYINEAIHFLDTLSTAPKETTRTTVTLASAASSVTVADLLVIRSLRCRSSYERELYIHYIAPMDINYESAVGLPVNFTRLNPTTTTLTFDRTSDQAYVLDIVYDKRTPDISSTVLTNFYTINYPMMLIYATCMLVESTYRNTQAVNDWERLLNTLIAGYQSKLAYDEYACGEGVEK